MGRPAPVFIDAAYAAEMLGVAPEVVLDWVQSGVLRTFGGRPSNPVLRSADVRSVADQFGVHPDERPTKRVKSISARVQTRLTADARWADLSAEDIREWARRADPARRQAARKAVEIAQERLGDVLRALDELA
jgi:hypothetical protein